MLGKRDAKSRPDISYSKGYSKGAKSADDKSSDSEKSCNE